MTDVRLVDLDVFKRYSLAIRQEAAPAEEVLAVLDASRRQVMAAAVGVEGAADPLAAADHREPDPAGAVAYPDAPDPLGAAGYREPPGPSTTAGEPADEDWAPDPAAWAAADAAADARAGEEQQASPEQPDPRRPARRRVRRTAGPAPGTAG